MSFPDGLSATRVDLCLFFLLLISSAVSTPCQSLDSTGLFDPSNAALMPIPGSIRQVSGKYPSSVPLILVLKSCPAVKPNFDPTGPNGSTYLITAASPGLSIKDPVTAAGCQLTTNLTIDPSEAQPGYVLVSVVEHVPAAGNAAAHDVAIGNAVLTFLSAAAGPIPGYPQVDVMWGVMSQHFCKDNFGKHVAGDLYCIQVTIGNNTGYPLQIAGIGFRPAPSVNQGTSDNKDGTAAAPRASPLPNASYLSVRSSAQAFQFWNAHNLTTNIPQATGIIMAAFNPFFHAAYSLARWTAGTAVIGTAIPGAGALLAPDVTIKQLTNLDDQALRDGKLIPNNTQIRTQVFVEREAIRGRPAYLAACASIYSTDADRNKCKKTADDVVAVKRALGDLIVVGDEVSFIQRLVVDPNVSSQEVNPGGSASAVQPTGVTVTGSADSPKFSLSLNSIPKNASQTKLTLKSGSTQVPLAFDSVDSEAGKINFKLPPNTAPPAGSATVSGTLPDGTQITPQAVTIPKSQY